MQKFQCPECHTEYELLPELIGQRVECGICNHKFTVEAPPDIAPASPPLPDEPSAAEPPPDPMPEPPPPENIPENIPASTDKPKSTASARTASRASARPAARRPKKTLKTKSSITRTPQKSRTPQARKPKPAAKKSKPIIPIVIGLIVVLGISAAAFIFLTKEHGIPIPQGLTKLTVTQPAPDKKYPTRYNGNDIEGIEKLVQEIERSDKTWRQDAEKRIDDVRKANLELWLADERGMALPGVEIRVRQLRHKFHFGGIASARRLVSGSKEQQKLYQDTYLAMGFNAGGFCNALKYKLKRGQERFLPDAFKWFTEHDIPVRGHCLIWPSQKHLPNNIAKLIDSGDKDAVRQACASMVSEWSSKWNVIAWDVINETRGNHEIQDILGHEIIADWFKIAAENAVNSDCRLLLNENRVVSDNKSGVLTSRMKGYQEEIRFLLKHNAPISGLGLQSRFNGNNPAEEIYKRLCLFDEFNLPITATEFELPTKTLKTEPDKARLLARVLTVYFSHHLVDGIFQWTIFPGGEDDSREIVDNNGHPNLRGKTWLYLTKKHWHTDRTLATDLNGKISLRGFKGSYIIEVNIAGTPRSFKLQLDKDTKAAAIIKTKP